MNLTTLTEREVKDLRERALRMGYNRLANCYSYELIRRRSERAKVAA